MEKLVQEEPFFRVSITQSTKLLHIWEVVVRGRTEEELKNNMEVAVKIATTKCKELNGQ